MQAYLLRDFALPRAERAIYGSYNAYRHELHAANGASGGDASKA